LGLAQFAPTEKFAPSRKVRSKLSLKTALRDLHIHDMQMYLEGLEIVDENIWHPEIVDQIEIHRIQLVHFHRPETNYKAIFNLRSSFSICILALHICFQTK
jgi:hypothetical protein